MSQTYLTKPFTPLLRWQLGLAALITCSLGSAALADNDQTMRTFYGDPGSHSSTPPAPTPPTNTTDQAHKFDWSKFSNHASQLYNKVERNGSGTQLMPNSTGYGNEGPLSAPGFGGQGAPYTPGSSSFSNAGILGPGHHLPSAAPNPATMPFEGGQAARDAEHERVLANMRKAGIGQSRIKNYEADGYNNPDVGSGPYVEVAPGVKMYTNGLTPSEALHNVTSNGVFNTPYWTDKDRYAHNAYGYYKGSGGTKTFDEWLHGER